MGRKNDTDLIRDMQERADHNINPYYWFNKVDSFQLAQWRASLAVSVIETVLISIGLIFVIAASLAEGKAQWILPAVLAPFWLLSLLRTMRWFSLQKNKPTVPPKPKERKKKLPKRPKNYGRN